MNHSRARRLHLLAASLVALLAGCDGEQKSVEASSRNGALPLIIADGTSVVDLGIIDAPAMVEREIQLVNGSREVVHIGRLTASCGCTQLGVSQTTVEPGETCSLRVTLDSAGKSGMTESTLIALDQSNSRIVVRVQLRAMVRVTAFLWSDPPRVDVGSVEPGSTVVVNTRISCRVPKGSAVPALVARYPRANGALTCTLVPVERQELDAQETACVCRVEARLSAPSEPGRFVESLLVETVDGKTNTRFAVVGTVIGR